MSEPGQAAAAMQFLSAALVAGAVVLIVVVMPLMNKMERWLMVKLEQAEARDKQKGEQ